MKIEDLLRKEVRELSFYEVEEIPSSKIEEEKIIKLDLNENFGVENVIMKNLLLSSCKDVDVRLYPPPYGTMAVRAISSFFGLDEKEVLVGNGSDEILDLI